MSISKNNLEVLLVSYIGNNIIDNNNKATKEGFHSFCWGELIVNLDEDRNILKIHFIYSSEYKNGHIGKYEECINFTISSTMNNSKKYLQELENEYHVDKNCLYRLIDILEDIRSKKESEKKLILKRTKEKLMRDFID